jgi:hypothetical protein
MRNLVLILIFVCALFAVPARCQQPTSKQVEDETRDTMRRMRTGEKVTRTDSGLDPCQILGSGIVAEVFGVEAAAIHYRAGSVAHPLCMASWRKPNADELEAAQGQRIQDWVKRQSQARINGQPFTEKIPVVKVDSTVSLTIFNETFASPEAAAERLEGMIDTMSKGVTVEVGGRKHTSQVDYDDWTPGVGDRAAWAPKLSELSVAARGVIFHVAVHVASEPAENRAQAIELARRVAGKL